jgi:hypothetical protein
LVQSRINLQENIWLFRWNLGVSSKRLIQTMDNQDAF